MKRIKPILRRLRYFPVAAPLVFVLFFFGLMPPRFDMILYTQNIVGEGTCTTYISSVDESFAFLYEANAYFGSELKTLRIPNIRFNVKDVAFWVYDVEEFDLCAIEISLFGRIITHIDADGVTHPLRKDIRGHVVSMESPLLHMAVDDPAQGTGLSFAGSDCISPIIWICYFALLLLIALLLSLGLAYLSKKAPSLLFSCLSAASIMIALLAGGFFCGSFPYVDYTDFLLNWLMLLSGALILNGLTLSWIGTVAVSLFTLFWYIANYFVISFRGKPIMPADLKAIGTAMQVVAGYTLKPTWQMALGILVVLIYCAAVLYIYSRLRKNGKERTLKRKLLGRAASVFVGIALILFSVNNSAFRSLNTFLWNENVKESFHREGIVLTYVNGLISSHVRRPEGYSAESVNSYLADYQAQEARTPEGIRPLNIIMVMNEAFSDLRTVGLDERIDVMPFLDQLKENTLHGDLYVSVYGGGTCNTEFEALTGNTLAFFGSGAYPYTENITDPMFSIASYLHDLGYETEAFHASKAQNWNRNRVYPHLGFDTFHSLESYPELTEELVLHSHPADLADYLYMENVSETYDGQPLFLFNVTIQNHSGYDHFEDLEEAEAVKEYGTELPLESRVYLSLIRASDDAVKQLVETYRDSDDPTMIIFFGDHQPGLSATSRNELYTTARTQLDFYKTKFFIWTNYETEAAEGVSISANYLPWLILERGNFPLPPYAQMLKEVCEAYPVICSMGVIDAEGNIYGGVSSLLDDPLIRKYQYVQYANVFDEIDPAWFRVN